MSKPPKTWKAVELAVARILGGRRCHHERQDVEAAAFSAEVKHGLQIPRTILKWWSQAKRNAPAGKLPILVLHPHGLCYADALVAMRLGDFAEVVEGLNDTIRTCSRARSGSALTPEPGADLG